MGITFTSQSQLLNTAPGTALGSSDWIEITQQRINQFADATGDHQWIHVDEARAKDGPFGACIAHGYLTLSIIALMLPQLMRVSGARMGVNYGCDKVRFPAPLRAGKRVRGHGEVVKVEPVDGGAQIWVRVTVEIENEPRPACVADTISRFIID